MITILLFLCLIHIRVLSSNNQILSIPLRPEKNIPFFSLSEISQICPPLELIFDTGSSDFWISDTSCIGCPKHSINCLQWVNTTNTKPKQIHYATGWVKGYEIDYQLCGIPTRIVCVTKAQDITHFKSDGVLGAGGNETGRQFIKKLFMRNQTKQMSIVNRRFSKSIMFDDLRMEMMEEKYLSGRLVKVQADIEWHVVVEKIIVKQQVIANRIQAMVDTGSELISVPQDIFNKIRNITQSIYSTNCTNVNIGLSCKCNNSYDILKLPNLTLSLQSLDNKTENLTLPPSRYALWKQRHCILLITSIPILGNKIVLGSSFLNQFPTTFNFQNHQLEIISLDHSKLNSVQNINILILLMIVIGIVIVSSKICIEVLKYYDEPGKLVI